MKILVINSLDKRYGSTYRIRRLKDALKSKGFEVIYAESNLDACKNEISVKQGDGFLGYLAGTIKRSWLSIRIDYDILIVQKFIPLTLPCILGAKIRGKKVIVDWDDLDTFLQNSLFRKYITAFCEWLGPKLPDMITTHSLRIRDLARLKTKRPVVVIDQGVDFEQFDPSLFSQAETKEKLGFEGKKILGYLCTLTQGGASDLDLILKVFCSLEKKDEDIRLLIVGGGPKEREVAKEIERSGVPNKVILTGLLKQDEVPAYIAAMDLSLVYMRDNPGNMARVSFKVLESLAMDKNIVGHLVGETAHRFAKYITETGESLKEFEKKIIEALKEKKLISRRKELREDYSWDIISKKYVEEIRKVLD